MGTLTEMEVFEILERGAKAPKGFKMIPMWIIFDVKMGTFRRKARLVASGHTTAPPEADTYSSVASMESGRLSFLLAQHNEMDLLSIDITNAYVNAKCREQVATIAGPEFGEYEGCVCANSKGLIRAKIVRGSVACPLVRKPAINRVQPVAGRPRQVDATRYT